MNIQIIEDIETGKLYRYSNGVGCYKCCDNEKPAKQSIIYSPNFKTDFMIKSVTHKGGVISVGQKCVNIGTIIDIEKRNSDLVFIGTRASGSIDFLNINPPTIRNKDAFNFEICD